jgi:hypothetical protein
MQFSAAKTNLCNTKLNISLTDVAAGNNALFALQDIIDAINFGLKKAWDYKPWTFTQKAYKTTIPNPYNGYIDYPNDFEDKSVYMIMVNAVSWLGQGNGKRNFPDYQKWFSDYPTDNSLIWSEFDRFIFLNANAVLVGQEVDVFGKLRAPTMVNDTDLLPFSPSVDTSQNSGNEAIITLAYSYLLSSEKKKNPTGAVEEEKRAYAILDKVWEPMGERNAEDTPQNRPFFNTGDLFPQRRNRFNTNIGNFP